MPLPFCLSAIHRLVLEIALKILRDQCRQDYRRTLLCPFCVLRNFSVVRFRQL